MTKKQVVEMLKDVVSEVDYDIYKEMFVDGYAPPEDQEQWVNNLVTQVSKHINIEEEG
jgi:hypothetical protein